MNGYTALHLAAKNGHLNACKTLIECGVKKSPRNYGKTPLDLAKQNNHLEIVDFLRNLRKRKVEENGRYSD